MKANHFTIMAIGIALLSNSCSDFLEETNPNKIMSNNYYASENDIVYAATGAYAAFRGTGYYKNMWIYTDLRSESTTVQDPGAGNGVNYQFYNYTLTTDNAQVKTHWTDLYKCVTRANIVLDQIDGIAFGNADDKERLKAEMRFLRALTYYHLVLQFGDVPLVTRELKTKDEIWEHTVRSPKSDVYKQIKEDLQAVISSRLPNLQTGNGVGRVSKAAGYALLGKVLLHKAADADFASERTANLQEAKENLTAAWSLKPFASLKDVSYADVFDKDKQAACPEIILQVMYLSGNADMGSNFATVFQPSAKTGLTSLRPGSGNNLPSDDMVSKYETGDWRKAISCGTSEGKNYIKKYTDLDDINGYCANDWIILRYADVALLLAEAKMHLGESDAAAYLNYVRERANLSPSTNPNLRDAIAHERKVELAFEGQSWYDLLRLYSKDELKTLMQAKNGNFSDKDFLLPSPYDEHKLNPDKMYQNEGYK